MIIQQITKLGIQQSRLCLPIGVWSRSKRCPAKADPCKVYLAKAKKPRKSPICSGKTTSDTLGPDKGQIRRLVVPGKCRLGFIPEEWFTFFSTKTGVTGPYFLMLGLANYLVSKEIYVMEHEYYSGLSIVLVLYLVTTKFGANIGAYLDKQVDEVHQMFQKVRDKDIEVHNNIIKEAELAKWRAAGQKELMAAKKENIALQLEAEFRERSMKVYKAVIDRMTYQIRKKRIETRMEQWWMVLWVVKKVRESITPEFRKQALASAIKELDAIASRQK